MTTGGDSEGEGVTNAAGEKYRFEVALSFAGDNKRSYVREVARLLRDNLGDGKVFLDEWFEAEIAGLDAQLFFQKVFKSESRLVVVFVCGRYNEKPWTQDEWRAICSLERTLRDVAKANIRRLRLLPLRFEDGDIDGMFDTAVVSEVRSRSPEEVSRLILERHRLIIAGKPESPKGAKQSEEAFKEKFDLGGFGQDSAAPGAEAEREDIPGSQGSDGQSRGVSGVLKTLVAPILSILLTLSLAGVVASHLWSQKREEMVEIAEGQIEELMARALVEQGKGRNFLAVELYEEACYKAEVAFDRQGDSRAAQPCIDFIGALIREREFEEARAQISKLTRPETPYSNDETLAPVLNNLRARLARAEGYPAGALEFSKEAFNRALLVYKDVAHPDMYSYRLNLGRDLRWNGEYGDAANIFRELVRERESELLFTEKKGMDEELVRRKNDLITVLYNQGLAPEYYIGLLRGKDLGLSLDAGSPCAEAVGLFKGVEDIETIRDLGLRHELLMSYGVAAHCAGIFSVEKGLFFSLSSRSLDRAIEIATRALNWKVASGGRPSAEDFYIEEVGEEGCWSGSWTGQPSKQDYPLVMRIIRYRLAMARLLINRGTPECACDIAEKATEALDRIEAGHLEIAEVATVLGGCLLAQGKKGEGDSRINSSIGTLETLRRHAYSSKYARGLLDNPELFTSHKEGVFR